MGSGIEVCLLCPGPTFSDLLEVAATEKPGEKFGESMRSTDKVVLRNTLMFNKTHTYKWIFYLENDIWKVCSIVPDCHCEQIARILDLLQVTTMKENYKREKYKMHLISGLFCHWCMQSNICHHYQKQSWVHLEQDTLQKSEIPEMLLRKRRASKDSVKGHYLWTQMIEIFVE